MRGKWDLHVADDLIFEESMDRLRKAAEVVKQRAKTRCPRGTISRPIYKSGPWAGKEWTARDGGALNRTIRIVEKDKGKAHVQFRNIRVYAGNYNVFYAMFVEYGGKAFLRPALYGSMGEIKGILENG